MHTNALSCLTTLVSLALIVGETRAEDWPRWRGPRGDGTWQAPKLPEQWPADGLARKWRVEVGGGYAGVTAARFPALDSSKPARDVTRVYTMDRLAPPRHDREIERVLCFDGDTGAELWKHVYDAPYGDLTYNSGPRASVTIHDGLAYTLGSVGHIFCLDAATGKVVWSKDTMKDHKAERPYWGFAASPVILGDLVLYHVGVPKGCVVAYDRKTGQEKWRGGDDPAGYCTPYLIAPTATGNKPLTRGEQEKNPTQIIIWTPESVLSLSPKNGETLWRYPYKIQYGVSIHTPLFEENTLFISSYWHGPRAFALGEDPRKFEIAWQQEKPLCGLMSQPIYRDGHCYFLDKDHGLTCFELKSGKKLWDDKHAMTPRGQNPQANLVWLGDSDRVIALNAKGDLILARLTPKGYEEQSRTKIIGDTWAHPAFKGSRVYARSDQELVCVEMAEK